MHRMQKHARTHARIRTHTHAYARAHMHVRIRTHARKHGDQAIVCVRTPLQQCGRPRHLRGAVSTLNLNKAERLERRWRGASLSPGRLGSASGSADPPQGEARRSWVLTPYSKKGGRPRQNRLAGLVFFRLRQNTTVHLKIASHENI